jgi:hypothetical protein
MLPESKLLSPWRNFEDISGTPALQRIGRVIILHDPFLSRAAVPEGSMVVSTAQAWGVGLSQRHKGTEGSLSGNADTRTIGNAETPPCSPWLCERKNAEGSGLTRRQRWKKSLDRIFFKYTLIG